MKRPVAVILGLVAWLFVAGVFVNSTAQDSPAGDETGDSSSGTKEKDAATFKFCYNIMVIFDTSGSMGEKITDVVNGSNVERTKIEIAKEAALQLLKEMRSDFHVGLIVFNDKVPRIASPIAPLTEVHRKRLSAQIEGAVPNGSTPIAASLKLAADELESYRLKRKPQEGSDRLVVQLGTVISLTDGQETCGGDIGATAKEIDPLIYWSYMIGFRLTPQQAAGYRGIGEYVDASDAASLQAAFKTIRLELEKPRTAVKERSEEGAD